MSHRAWVFVASSVVSALLLGFAVAWWIATREDGRAPRTTVRPSLTVVTAVRDLAKLETTEYHLERVIDLQDRQSRFFGMLETKDAILLVAAGDVTAGVDLTGLREGDIVVDAAGRSASLTVPAATVFSTRLDNRHTYVRVRETDLLANRDEALESRAREEAERTITEGAKEAKILERATRNAEIALGALVRGLGYDTVHILFREPTPR